MKCDTYSEKVIAKYETPIQISEYLKLLSTIHNGVAVMISGCRCLPPLIRNSQMPELHHLQLRFSATTKNFTTHFKSWTYSK